MIIYILATKKNDFFIFLMKNLPNDKKMATFAG